MKLGLMWGYWGARRRRTSSRSPRRPSASGSTRCGRAEAWGSDAFSPLAWIAGHTSTIKLGTSVVQLAARTPTATAMAAITHRPPLERSLPARARRVGPAGRRGLVRPARRTSRWPAPASTSRSSAGCCAARSRSTSRASSTSTPTTARAASGWASRCRSITHPLRADIPIYLGAEGPKNVAMTAEIADGWLPLYYSPLPPRGLRRVAGGRQARLRHRRRRPGQHQRRPRGRR